jgi:hypothetical protein
MKHLKRFGLASMAVTAVMALAAVSASATELYSGATTRGGGTTIEMSLSGTSSTTTTGGTVFMTCTGGGLKGTISKAGGAGVNVVATVAKSDLTWSGCTKTTDTVEGGTLEIAWTSGASGTVTGKGFRVTWVTSAEFGGTCGYTLGSTAKTLGELKGVASGDATLAINGVVNGAEGNSFLCPSDLKWVANYTFTSPTPLHVTNS